MNKRRLFLSSLIGIILFACGGGGGGGGGGGTDTGSTTINTQEYFNKDETRTYTYSVTSVDGSTYASTTQTLVYSYEQIPTIPSKYGYSGAVAGPYYLETQTIDGTVDTLTYISATGTPIVMDDLSVYTMNDGDLTISTGYMPAEKTIGTDYTMNSTQTLMISDPDSGTVGENVGTLDTRYTVRVLGPENITVNGTSYEAIRTQETASSTTTTSQISLTINSSSSVWYGKNIGPVKIVANNTTTATDGIQTITGSSSVISELTSVTP